MQKRRLEGEIEFLWVGKYFGRVFAGDRNSVRRGRGVPKAKFEGRASEMGVLHVRTK